MAVFFFLYMTYNVDKISEETQSIWFFSLLFNAKCKSHKENKTILKHVFIHYVNLFYCVNSDVLLVVNILLV